MGIGLADKGEMEKVAVSSHNDYNNVFTFSDYNDLQRVGDDLKDVISLCKCYFQFKINMTMNCRCI